MSEPVHIRDAAADPALRDTIENLIGAMRAGVAPFLFGAPDDESFATIQSAIVTASAMMAGFTVGHMRTCGLIDQDEADAMKLVAMQGFDSGVDQGAHEARQAIVRAKLAEARRG